MRNWSRSASSLTLPFIREFLETEQEFFIDVYCICTLHVAFQAVEIEELSTIEEVLTAVMQKNGK